MVWRRPVVCVREELGSWYGRQQKKAIEHNTGDPGGRHGSLFSEMISWRKLGWFRLKWKKQKGTPNTNHSTNVNESNRRREKILCEKNKKKFFFASFLVLLVTTSQVRHTFFCGRGWITGLPPGEGWVMLYIFFGWAGHCVKLVLYSLSHSLNWSLLI